MSELPDDYYWHVNMYTYTYVKTIYCFFSKQVTKNLPTVDIISIPNKGRDEMYDFVVKLVSGVNFNFNKTTKKIQNPKKEEAVCWEIMGEGDDNIEDCNILRSIVVQVRIESDMYYFTNTNFIDVLHCVSKIDTDYIDKYIPELFLLNRSVLKSSKWTINKLSTFTDRIADIALSVINL